MASPIDFQSRGLNSSQKEADSHFQSVQEEFESRWKVFAEGREFKLFKHSQSDEILKEEFKEIQNTRELIWDSRGYARAEHLISGNLVRAPECAAFAYNNAVPYYNATTVCLGGRYYIACEGPRSKDVESFFRLLTSRLATHLVRLTDAYEGETKKCHPYWDGRIIPSSDGANLLQIQTEAGDRTVRAFDLAHWKDHHGIDPEELLSLVLRVRRELDEVNGLLVVHCSAGVGRTGTFLAALAIVGAIDQGISFSIEEIVYRLSLQRVYSVAKFSQYITLHKVAELYMKDFFARQYAAWHKKKINWCQ